jgi:hypothetical protein
MWWEDAEWLRTIISVGVFLPKAKKAKAKGNLKVKILKD